MSNDLFKNAETEITCTNCSVCTQFWTSGCVPLEDGSGVGIGWNWNQGFCVIKKKNVAGTSTCEKFEKNGLMPREILLALNAGESVKILQSAFLESTERRRKGKERDEKNSIVECDDGEIRTDKESGPSIQPNAQTRIFDWRILLLRDLWDKNNNSRNTQWTLFKPKVLEV